LAGQEASVKGRKSKKATRSLRIPINNKGMKKNCVFNQGKWRKELHELGKAGNKKGKGSWGGLMSWILRI
jgi:hypothetical protein